jgi:hypothetical protein
MRSARRGRTRHAAARARKLTAIVSIVAFAGIGQAIDLAARTTTTAQVAVTQSAGSPASLVSSSKRSAAASTTTTTSAVTSTHAS